MDYREDATLKGCGDMTDRTFAHLPTWQISAVELPAGDRTRDRWIDAAGRLVETPIDSAPQLPGRYACFGLVDAHAHPAIAPGPTGPIACDAQRTGATLVDWARQGVLAVRDVGSPGGAILDLTHRADMPYMTAAGRFLAPAGRYFPELLPAPAPADELKALALGELRRGAGWVKVIADFATIEAGVPAGPATPTYPMPILADTVAAVHAAGGRVAAHCGTTLIRDLVAAGVDSIEHGTSMDEVALREMAAAGTAWIPTLSAVLGSALPEGDERHEWRKEFRERLTHLLPIAVELGVPVLAGTDTAGTVAGEVDLLFRSGLEPIAALEAATTTAYRYLRIDLDRSAGPACLVTYDRDPRNDPEALATPSAVILNGFRIR